MFQSHLEKLEHMLEDDDPRPEIGKQVAAASRAFSRLHAAFREELR